MTRKQYAGALGVLAAMGLLGGIIGASVVDAIDTPDGPRAGSDLLSFDDQGLLCVRGLRIETPDGKKQTTIRPGSLWLDTLSGLDSSDPNHSEGHVSLTTGEGGAHLNLEGLRVLDGARSAINVEALGDWPKVGMSKGLKGTVILHHMGPVSELTLKREDGKRVFWSLDVRSP